MYERHFQEAAEVLGGLLEPGEYAAVLFEPADKSFDDVAVSICLAIEFDRAGIPIFILFGGNHGRDSQVDQIFINPVRAVSLVACNGHGPGDRLAITVNNVGIGAFQQRFQGGRLVRLPRRQMEVQRMAFTVAEDMDFCGKTPARTA